MTNRFRILTLFFCLFPVIATAEIYKWVDEQGQVHYSQNRPVDQQVETIKGPSKVDTEAAQKALQERRDKLNAIDEERAEENKKAAEAEKQAQANKERCNAALEAMARLRSQNRMQYINEEGERAFMTEEQRQQRLEEAQKAVEESCQ